MTTPQPPRAFCCEPMRGYSTAQCQEHRDEPALCSDVLVVHSERHGPGLPIHVDGGGGMIVIEFCPWCGTRIGDGAGTATPAGHVAVEEPGVLWMAMRYALGRATYAVGEVGDAIERHADSLGLGQRQRMAAEIAAAIAEGRAGMDMDVAVWRRAVHRLVGEEPGRSLLAGGEQS